MAAVVNYTTDDVENLTVVIDPEFVPDADIFEIELITKEGATMPTTGGGI
jgi:hypothetical protein